MANESLNNASVVVKKEIPQTLQESAGQVSIVAKQEIPQTLQESAGSFSVIVKNEIPQTLQESVGFISVVRKYEIPATLQESTLGTSLVVAQANEIKRNFICNSSVSIQGQSKQTGIYIDLGYVFPVLQGNIANSQF